MTTLISPGDLITIVDQSATGSGIAGTIPLFVIATAANKTSPDGSGTAAYTTAAKKNTLSVATGQRSLVLDFGNPIFQTYQSSPLHGNELNEYGLLAAYQFLGIYNQALILRADVDLAQLAPSTSAPTGAPVAGTYWFDTVDTAWGLFHNNGNALAGAAWESQTVHVVGTANASQINGVYVPASSYGTDGDFAVVTVTSDNKFYQRVSGSWYELGTASWSSANSTIVYGTANPSALTAGMSFNINNTTVTISSAGALSDVVAAINAAAIAHIHASVSNNAIALTNTAGGSIQLANVNGTPLATLGLKAGTTSGVTVVRTNDAQYPAGYSAGSVWIKGSTANKGAKWAIKYFSTATNSFQQLTAPFYPYTSTASDGDPTKDLAAFAGLGQPTAGNVYVGYDASARIQVIRRWSGARWEDLIYQATSVEPTTAPTDGTLWYNSNLATDIMVGDGQKWTGYRRTYPSTDPNGVIIAGSAPVAQSDGTALVDYDLWLDGSDLENYPALYRYNAETLRWVTIDKTDQTTPFGIVFADARADSGTTFTGIPNQGLYSFNSTAQSDMLLSDFLDPDAPDPREHPAGMLLFNMRYSSYNVKKWTANYFAQGNYDENTNFTQESYEVGTPEYLFPPLATAGRWVNASPLKYDGSPNMGRHAQRVIVTQAMTAAIETNPDIRAEGAGYNLIAAPGYPELIAPMVSLNTDIKQIAFVVGDTPARLAPDGTSVQNWATNAAVVPDNGDAGLVTSDTYTAIHYPWGLSSNVDGTSVMIPPSSIALNVIAFSDQVSYPWFAPAGLTRGLVNNATSVGYLTSEGEFKPTLLNQGQRDVLYQNRVNPIHYIKGSGLVVDGQKTLCAESTSALSRINVARLACYLKINLDRIVKPFLFEQNDEQTRESALRVVSTFLSSLVQARALEDFAVVCDTSNNTAARRDANELWIDIAIQPVKAIEFIYVPVRVQSSEQTINATQ